MHQQRVPGLDAVTEHSKLMVLGKLGAGKTTFLKHIAIECNQGNFEANLIPTFIPLKIFVEEARSADDLRILQLMKQQTDALVAKDDKLQQFLIWVNEKSLSIEVPYKLVAVRAFYLAIAFARDLGLPSNSGRSRDIALLFNLNVYSNSNFDIVLDYNLSRLLIRRSNLPFAIEQHNYDLILRIHDDLSQFFANIFVLNLPLELRKDLEQIQEDRTYCGYNIFSEKWWQPHKSLIKQLRKAMIQHRNIGHDWQFSEHQKELLKEYYDANKLLVDCLNSSNVTPKVRNEIEETLLLPIAEIEKPR